MALSMRQALAPLRMARCPQIFLKDVFLLRAGQRQGSCGEQSRHAWLT